MVGLGLGDIRDEGVNMDLVLLHRDETCVNIHSNFVMCCTYRYSNVTNLLAKEDLSGSDRLSQE